MSPRELESSLLLKAARQLQAAHDNWDADAGTLADALDYNKKLWTLLVSAVTKPDNPLPASIRENVANIGIFMLGQIFEMSLDPRAEKLKIMVDLNRELAGGLRSAA